MKGLIFTYLLTYGGSAVALFKPYHGLLIYVCFAIVRPESMWHWSVPDGNYSRTVAIALLIGWMFKSFGVWNFGRARSVVYALLGFWIWAILSGIIMTGMNDRSWGFIEPLTKIVLPFMVGMTTITTMRQVKQLAWVILVSQGYVAYHLNESYYEGFNQVQLFGFGGMDNNCVAIAMVCGTGFALFMGLTAEKWWQKGVGIVCALLMAHVVMFSFSRGGMLGLIITGAVSFFLVPKGPKHYLLFAVAVLVAYRLAGNEVIEEFMTAFVDPEERDYSTTSRLDMWKACIELMIFNPIFGIGPHHFPTVAPNYGFTYGKEAHTLWLQIGAELGFIGLGFLVAFYGICVFQLFRLAINRRVDPFVQDIARMVTASLAGFAVAGQFVSLWGLELPYYVVLVGAGALKVWSLQEARQPHGSLPPGRYAQPQYAGPGWSPDDEAVMAMPR